MKKQLILPLIILVIISGLLLYLASHNTGFLNPKGLIAFKQRQLLLTMIGLMLVAVIPTFITFFFIVFKYRESNSHAQHEPNKTSSKFTQAIFWSITTIFVIGFAIINWKSTHQLDPYKPIESTNKPITIQVVALQWRWMFIYPEQHIATINYIQFPVNTPVNFQLTADAPMSSFWIPQLGGQIYAMTGMETQTHLMATEIGEFQGSDAEINGIGMAGMRFKANATSQQDFDKWVYQLQSMNRGITGLDTFNELAKPTENTDIVYLGFAYDNLFNDVMNKYMTPSNGDSKMDGMENMEGMKH